MSDAAKVDRPPTWPEWLHENKESCFVATCEFRATAALAARLQVVPKSPLHTELAGTTSDNGAYTVKSYTILACDQHRGIGLDWCM